MLAVHLITFKNQATFENQTEENVTTENKRFLNDIMTKE